MTEGGIVCERCKRSIEEEATQCEHCGYSKDRGPIWNLIGVTQIFNPVGWFMLSDNLREKTIGEEKDKKSFWEEIQEINAEAEPAINEIEGKFGQVLSLLLLAVVGITTLYGFILLFSADPLGAVGIFLLVFIELGVGLAVMNYFETNESTG